MEPKQPEEPVHVGYNSMVFAGWASGSFLLLVLGLTGRGIYTLQMSLVAIAFITIVTVYYHINI